MAGALLETKLYAPRHREGFVRRARLDERITRGASARLTLVSAPAGFGKSTLIAEAIGRRGSAAWLSLDDGDDDPATFWAYVIAALRTIGPQVGESARALIDSRQASIEAALTTLLNDLDAMAEDVTLVLDDYHAIDATEIHRGVAFLLDHLPARTHVVISTRADPPLPLARMRARGELVEIRAADLRFTSEEAAAYLGGAMGLALSTDDVEALESRTEGWIAALQLAGLSMQGRDDVTRFIADFAGDDRYIVDLLVEEVLDRQPADVQGFLLATSAPWPSSPS